MASYERYIARRKTYLERLGPRACAVVASLPERIRNGTSHHAFRQQSDLLYLTGFHEPEAVLVLRPGADLDRQVLFVRPRDRAMETWDGRRKGLEGAVNELGVDVAYPIAELDQRLAELICNVDELHFSVGLDDALDLTITKHCAALRRMEKKGKRPPRAIVDPRAVLHELRLHKQPDEIETMRQAATISANAHIAAMRLGRPGVWEYQLEAEVAYGFRRHGGTAPGYTTIVGAGRNATILHYVENDQQVADGDLVLIDAGCEVDGYTADITRTFPANGRFSASQRAVYDIVLDAQLGAIALARPGATLDQIHDHCVRRLTEGMITLGLLTGTVDERIADGGYRKYYMHGTSHWLGIDVHDAGAYTIEGVARPLVPGMVLTIEPGMYIADDDDDAPAALRGIGVRIEDDILITADGHEVLTAACPKLPADVEAICQR